MFLVRTKGTQINVFMFQALLQLQQQPIAQTVEVSVESETENQLCAVAGQPSLHVVQSGCSQSQSASSQLPQDQNSACANASFSTDTDAAGLTSQPQSNSAGAGFFLEETPNAPTAAELNVSQVPSSSVAKVPVFLAQEPAVTQYVCSPGHGSPRVVQAVSAPLLAPGVNQSNASLTVIGCPVVEYSATEPVPQDTPGRTWDNQTELTPDVPVVPSGTEPDKSAQSQDTSGAINKRVMSIDLAQLLRHLKSLPVKEQRETLQRLRRVKTRPSSGKSVVSSPHVKPVLVGSDTRGQSAHASEPSVTTAHVQSVTQAQRDAAKSRQETVTPDWSSASTNQDWKKLMIQAVQGQQQQQSPVEQQQSFSGPLGQTRTVHLKPQAETRTAESPQAQKQTPELENLSPMLGSGRPIDASHANIEPLSLAFQSNSAQVVARNLGRAVNQSEDRIPRPQFHQSQTRGK